MSYDQPQPPNLERVRVVMDRFMAKVSPEPNTGCWMWMGHISQGGYGYAWDGSAFRTAHRVSWEMANPGLSTSGMHVDHLCRHRWCVNPAHLEAVTPRENVIVRSASATAIAHMSGICRRGHKMVARNGGKPGRHRCLVCQASYDKARAPRSRKS